MSGNPLRRAKMTTYEDAGVNVDLGNEVSIGKLRASSGSTGNELKKKKAVQCCNRYQMEC